MSRSAGFWDVVIVGGGITGIALGLVLTQGGLRVRVLERGGRPDFRPEPGFDQRIYAMSERSRDFLTRAGGWQRIDPERLMPIKAMKIRGDRDGALEFAPPIGARQLGWIAESGAMLAGLLGAVERQVPELVRFHSTVQTLEGDSRARSLTLDQGQVFRTHLVVAADGVQSGMRTLAGIDARFHPYGQTALVANYRITVGHRGVARQWFVPREIIALLPLPGDRVSLVWSATEDHARALHAMAPAERVAALQAVVGTEVGLIEEISVPAVFPLRRMEVSAWTAPRFVLVGDAAHGVHPMAGQGLNLGLQDAAQLADDLLTRGTGPDCGDRSVLRRYARARAEPIWAMNRLAGGLNALFAQERGAGLRNWGMGLVDGCEPLKRWLVEQANR